MIELTKMEKQALDAITKDDFYENGLDSCLWTDCYLDTLKDFYNIESKEARGVISSLIKKGVISPIPLKSRESTISLTPYGKEVMMKLGYND